jgi:hypothetical protein
MRYLVLGSLIVASALSSVAPAGAAGVKMHSARVMVGQTSGAMGRYYEVKMNGRMYAMMPMASYDKLLQSCKAMQQC